MRILARSFVIPLFSLLLFCGAASAQADIELLMFERAGCPWCVRWDKEVAPIYPKTETGSRIPLRKINLDYDKSGAVKLDLPVRFTPTFVLVRSGKEVGRIIGYRDDATFWGLLEQMAAKYPAHQPNPIVP